MNVSGLSPVDGFQCPNCLNCMRVVLLDADHDGWLESDEEGDLSPNYCPVCGWRIEE